MRREVVEPLDSSSSLQAIQLNSEIDESRRPYLASVFAATNQSLVNRDAKLSTITEGLEFGFFPTRQTQVILDYLPTIFKSGGSTLGGQEFRSTILGQPTNRLSYVASFGLFNTFGHDVHSSLSVLGKVGVRYRLTDRIAVSTDFNRYLIANSALTATGLNLPLSGRLVGPVKANQFATTLEVRPTPKTNLTMQYGIGMFEGQNLSSNLFQEGNMRIARTLISHEPTSHLQYLQLSYQLLFLSFAHNLSGFGNLSSIPSDSVNTNIATLQSAAFGQTSTPGTSPGVGGYFSPRTYFLSNFRLDAGGRLYKHMFWDAGVGLGPQNFQDLTTSLGHTSLVGTANLSLIAKISRHITCEQGAYFLQAATSYGRFVCYQQTRYYF
jgi:hypothetical protein